jgi:hypothetical protein
MPLISMRKYFLIILFLTVLSFPQLAAAKIFEDLFTSVTILLVCGDGNVEGEEVCDPGNLPLYAPNMNGKVCGEFDDIFGNPYFEGDMNCLPDCSNFDPSMCFTCGNTVKENAEECDNEDFGGKTCINLGFVSGNLICTTCRISLQNCVAKPVQGGGGFGSSGGASGNTFGYLPGSKIAPGETKVAITGKSYPESDVHILIDGKVIGIVRTDEKANFYFETSDVAPGVVGFGFWSEDPDGLKSTLFSLIFRVTSGAITNISGVYLSPTIDISSQSLKQGENIKIFGKTVPESEVLIQINSAQEFNEQTNSKKTGDWELIFNTEKLEEDFHTAKALFHTTVSDNVIKSGFSRSVSFYVGKIGGTPACPEADLNKDKRVNITDFSILLYHWGTDNACADQNQNGIVDLIDFSIMMYYWTG